MRCCVADPDRPAWNLTLEDAPAVARLLEQLGYPTTPDQARTRMQRLDDAAHTIVGYRVDGEVVGFGAARLDHTLQRDEPVGRIIALAVDPAHRGKGGATRIVRRLEGWARDKGARSMTVNSGSQRKHAHRWYEKRGYQRTGDRFGRTL